MKNLKAIILALGIFIIALVGILTSQDKVVVGGAPAGLASTMATSSTISVGPQAVTALYTSNTYCTSRVISTVAQPIMLSFNAMSSTTVSGVSGHYQAASTTVSYDSGEYGCGLMSAYGFNASTTITKSEFN